MFQLSKEAQQFYDKFKAAWEKFKRADNSDDRYEAQGDYREYAVDLALQLTVEEEDPAPFTDAVPVQEPHGVALFNLDTECTDPLPYMCPTCVTAEGGHIDQGAVDRARAVARILARRAIWDGVSAITVIDPYEIHDRLTQRWVKVETGTRGTVVTAADSPVASPIWGISPDETDLDPQTQEIPDNTAATLTVRDILVKIHTAASQAHYSRRSYEQTLLYIQAILVLP